MCTPEPRGSLSPARASVPTSPPRCPWKPGLPSPSRTLLCKATARVTTRPVRTETNGLANGSRAALRLSAGNLRISNREHYKTTICLRRHREPFGSRQRATHCWVESVRRRHCQSSPQRSTYHTSCILADTGVSGKSRPLHDSCQVRNLNDWNNCNYWKHWS